MRDDEMGTDLLAARLIYNADEHGQAIGAEGHKQEGTVQHEVDGLTFRFCTGGIGGYQGIGGRIVAVLIDGDASGVINLRELQLQFAGHVS